MEYEIRNEKYIILARVSRKSVPWMVGAITEYDAENESFLHMIGVEPGEMPYEIWIPVKRK
jgi:hypothetical protein